MKNKWTTATWIPVAESQKRFVEGEKGEEHMHMGYINGGARDLIS